MSSKADRTEPPGRPRRRRWLLGSTLLLAAILSAFFVRNIVTAEECLTKGDAARGEGRWDAAIFHYRHAAESYVPYSGTSGAALERLIALGDDRLEKGDAAAALFAFRSARFAVLASRHLFCPYEAMLPAIHDRIEKAGSFPEERCASGAAERRERYRRQGPAPRQGFLGGLCFLTWGALLPVIAYRGFREDGRSTRALPYLFSAFVVFFVLWCVLLLVA